MMKKLRITTENDTKKIKVVDRLTFTGRRPNKVRFETTTNVLIAWLDETNDCELAILTDTVSSRY